MTNPMVVDNFAATFAAADSSAIVQDNLSAGRANEIRWQAEVLAKNAQYEMALTKTAGRSVDDPPEYLVDDLQDGRLPSHIHARIAKQKGSPCGNEKDHCP